MPFKTGKDYVRPGVPDRGAATIIHLRRAAGHVDELFRAIPDPTPGDPTGEAVVARLNHGRWIGDCNLQDSVRGRTCLNAQLVDPDDPRFFCTECFNAAVGGRWRPVTWPADRAGIEAPLDRRPVHEQNWEPPPKPRQDGKTPPGEIGELHPGPSEPTPGQEG